MNIKQFSFGTGSVLLALSSSLGSVPVLAQEGRIEEISIIGTRTLRESRGATGLQLSVFDTPQSVSLIDNDFMEGFGLNEVNDVLKLTTGVNVEEVETDRTYYNSRGFDIKSMQVDGHGLPFTWNVHGELDTVIYERVEVIRGANGLLTGTGNPSGTINYVRKRPTNDFQGSIKLTQGSWSNSRAELDISIPFTDSGSWAGRAIVAGVDKESYLRDNEQQRQIFYGVIDGQLTRNSTLALGYTHHRNDSDGVMWGALQLIYDDGTPTDFDVSSSTTMDWTYWTSTSRNAFAELQVDLARGWEWTTTLNYNDEESDDELFYTYGTLNQASGLGLFGWPGKYVSSVEQKLIDSTLAGSFSLGGREHELFMGLNISQSKNGYLDHSIPATDPAWGALPAFPGWDGSEIARPDFQPPFVAQDFDIDVNRFYIASNWSLNDAMNLIVGANVIDTEASGDSFGSPMNWSETEASPYIGLVYALGESVNLYASYSDIYEPQAELTASLNNIGPAEGKSFEGGIKAEFFAGGLLTSASVFKAEQDNYAEYAGFDAGSGLSYYAGTEVNSQGFELEASGRINDAVILQAGFTQLDLEGQNGSAVRSYVPERTLKAGARFFPLANLELGASYRWQSDIYTGTAPMRISQDSYGILSAYADYDFNDALNIALNINNLGDEKYLNSLYWDQNYFGAPRHYSLSLKYSF